MKIHRSATPRMIEANRNNSKKSTGPRTEQGKHAVRHNAVRHGILAKQILFRQNDPDKHKFKSYLNSLESCYAPVGVVEKMLVEEIGATWWKLQTAERWELKAIRRHKENSVRVLEELKDLENHKISILQAGMHPRDPLWDCDTLVIRSLKGVGSAASRHYPTVVPAIPPAKGSGSESGQTSGGIEIEAVLRSPLPTVLRYQASLKRDLYKAIHTLEEMQARRKLEYKNERRKKKHHQS